MVACALLTVVPAVVLLAGGMAATVHALLTGPDEAPSLAAVSVVVFPIPLLVMMVFEWEAVVRRRAVFAFLLGMLFLFPAAIVIVPLLQAIAATFEGEGALGELPPGQQAVALGAFLAYCLLIAVGHLRWWRALLRAGAVMDLNEPPPE